MSREDAQPRRRRSVYEDRPPAPCRDGRRIAASDEDGRLRWVEDWREQTSGWWPLEAFLRGRARW